MISIADSLRVLQHVETVSIPNSWDSLDLKSWREISWNKKQFEVCKFLKILHKFVYLSCCCSKEFFSHYFKFGLWAAKSWEDHKNNPGNILFLLFLYSPLDCVQTSPTSCTLKWIHLPIPLKLNYTSLFMFSMLNNTDRAIMLASFSLMLIVLWNRKR